MNGKYSVLQASVGGRICPWSSMAMGDVALIRFRKKWQLRRMELWTEDAEQGGTRPDIQKGSVQRAEQCFVVSSAASKCRVASSSDLEVRLKRRESCHYVVATKVPENRRHQVTKRDHRRVIIQGHTCHLAFEKTEKCFGQPGKQHSWPS